MGKRTFQRKKAINDKFYIFSRKYAVRKYKILYTTLREKMHCKSRQEIPKSCIVSKFTTLLSHFTFQNNHYFDVKKWWCIVNFLFSSKISCSGGGDSGIMLSSNDFLHRSRLLLLFYYTIFLKGEKIDAFISSSLNLFFIITTA